jgi:hypothetical protein
MARIRRRNMRSVDVWAVDFEGEQPLSALFANRCKPIYEFYTYQLKRGAPIKASCSWTRLFPDDGISPGTASDFGEEPADNFGFSESTRCPVDREILRSERPEWPRLYLEWLHARMLELAHARSWDAAPLEAARQGCLDADVNSFYAEWVRVEGPPFTGLLQPDAAIPDVEARQKHRSPQ